MDIVAEFIDKSRRTFRVPLGVHQQLLHGDASALEPLLGENRPINVYVEENNGSIPDPTVDGIDAAEDQDAEEKDKSSTSKTHESTDKAGDDRDKVWDNQAVLALIRLWEQHKEMFSSPKYKKKSVWKKITAEHQMLGYKFSSIQVEAKWKNITKRFRDVIDHNNRSGNDRKTCPFFTELGDVYGYKPNINPIVSGGSMVDNGTSDRSDDEEKTKRTKSGSTK